jgi:hypothetical protein
MDYRINLPDRTICPRCKKQVSGENIEAIAKLGQCMMCEHMDCERRLSEEDK